MSHFDRVVEAELVECLIPLFDPRTHNRPQVDRDRLLHVEDDRLLRGRDLCRRIEFLQIPAIDETNEILVVAVVSEVLRHGQKVADTVVGLAWLVGGLWQLTDAVVNGDLHPARIGDRV